VLKASKGGKSLQLQRFLQFVPVIGSRELEGKVAKGRYLLERELRVGAAMVTTELR
jgi:hypothetical protein